MKFLEHGAIGLLYSVYIFLICMLKFIYSFTSFSKEENVKKESVYDFVDSDDDNLVVDENPSSSKRQRADIKKQNYPHEIPSDIQPGALRLRLSCMCNYYNY